MCCNLYQHLSACYGTQRCILRYAVIVERLLKYYDSETSFLKKVLEKWRGPLLREDI